MKKSLLLIAIVLLSVSFSYADSVKIAFFNTYPHIAQDHASRKISGALYDLIQDHIAPAMGVDFVWDNSPSSVPRQIKNLETNRNGAAVLLAYTPDRAKLFSYSKTPFFQGKSGIALPTNSPLTDIINVDDILSFKIGYANKTFVTPFMRDKRIKFDMVGSPNFLEMNIKKLLKGRIQAAYAPDQAGLLYVIKKLNVDNKVKVLKLPERSASFHVVFSKRNADKKALFDQAFDKINGSVIYLELLKKYIDISKL